MCTNLINVSGEFVGKEGGEKLSIQKEYFLIQYTLYFGYCSIASYI